MVVSQRAVGWCKAADLLQCLTPERQVNERAYGFAQRSVRQKMRRQTKLMRRIPDRYGFIFPSGYAYVKKSGTAETDFHCFRLFCDSASNRHKRRFLMQ